MLCQAQALARRSRRARLEPSFAQGRLFETRRRSRAGFARSSGVRRRGRKRPGLGVTKVQFLAPKTLESLSRLRNPAPARSLRL